MAERSLIGLTADNIRLSQDRFDLLEGDRDSLIRGIQLRMHKEQSALLHHHLTFGKRKNIHEPSYHFGGVSTYDGIPDSQRLLPIDPLFIHSGFKVLESVKASGPNAGKRILNDRWFNYLFQVAPDYLRWLVQKNDEEKKLNQHSSFVEGSLSIALPMFYREASVRPHVDPRGAA